MKPHEILAALPNWSKASPGELIASPAWAMPCRIGDTACVMRLAEIHPSDTLSLNILLEREEHVLCLTDNEQAAELHAIWPSRLDVPEPILLALVEKEYGPLFQMLENATRRQLQVVGLAPADHGNGIQPLCLQVVSEEKTLFSFTLSSSPALVEQFGKLRYLDSTNPALRTLELAAETEYASFALPAAEVASLAPGDALLLPEIDTIPPRIVVDGRFMVTATDVMPWKNDSLVHVFRGEPSAITLGELFDCATSPDAPRQKTDMPLVNTPLKIVIAGSTLATGRFDHLAGQPAFMLDATTH